MNDTSELGVWGHVLIRDSNTKEILVDKKNSIHYENFSLALARGLAYRPDGNIHEMHFGNGGASVSGTDAITYFPPNNIGMTADLYNPTFFKVVNDLSPLNTDSSKNFIEVRHIVGTVYSDIIVVCNLDYNEPNGQEAFDDSTNFTGSYVFNEIGLKTYDPVPGGGLLLTHLCFNPIQKSLNRSFDIEYTIRIKMG